MCADKLPTEMTPDELAEWAIQRHRGALDKLADEERTPEEQAEFERITAEIMEEYKEAWQALADYDSGDDNRGS